MRATILEYSEMTAGRSVAVLFHDAGNPSDAAVIAVWT